MSGQRQIESQYFIRRKSNAFRISGLAFIFLNPLLTNEINLFSAKLSQAFIDSKALRFHAALFCSYLQGFESRLASHHCR
jgi:hypothetical protein